MIKGNMSKCHQFIIIITLAFSKVIGTVITNSSPIRHWVLKTIPGASSSSLASSFFKSFKETMSLSKVKIHLYIPLPFPVLLLMVNWHNVFASKSNNSMDVIPEWNVIFVKAALKKSTVF